jgi:hypothetical protein
MTVLVSPKREAKCGNCGFPLSASNRPRPSNNPRRKSVGALRLVLRPIAFALLLGLGIFTYAVIPPELKSHQGLPALTVEDLGWQWCTAIDRPSVYNWFLRNWPSEANVHKVARKTEDWEWRQSKSSNTYEDYSGYLGRFPAGAHARDAREELEKRLWERVKAIGLQSSYTAYLEEYPNGVYASDALGAVNLLKAKKGRD